MKKNLTKAPPKPNFKHTELGWIPKEWKVEKLKDFGEIYTGGTPSTKDLSFWNGNIIWYTPTEIRKSNKYISNSEKKISKLGIKHSTSKLVPKLSLIIATRATIGEISITEIECTFNQGLKAIDVNQSNSYQFIYYLIQYSKKEMLKRSCGSTFLELSTTDFKKLKFPLPPLHEQQAIADCLSIWDKAIDKQQQLIKTKEQQHKGLRQLLLTGKKRLNNPETGQVFDKEWVEKRLGEYFIERKETNLNNLPLLSIGENGVYPQSESNKKDTSNKNKDKYKRICPNDIGYNTMRLWQGRSALSDLEGIVSPAYTILKPSSKANSLFFSYLFKLNSVIHRFYRNSQGMVSDTLNCKYKDFSIIKLKLPNLKEQKVIAEVLETSSKEIEILQQQLHQFQLQKKGLMQQLLSGTKQLDYEKFK